MAWARSRTGRCRPTRTRCRSRAATAPRSSSPLTRPCPQDRARFVGEAVAHGRRGDAPRPRATAPSASSSTGSRGRPPSPQPPPPRPTPPMRMGRLPVERLRRLRGRRRRRHRRRVRARGPRGAARDAGAIASPACRWSRARRSATSTPRADATPSTPARAAPGASQADVAGALGVPATAVRVIARDVGGNYGTRNSCYPEYALVAWAARRLGRPVKWTGDRREAIPHRLPGPRPRRRTPSWRSTPTARFLAFRAVNTSNVGAHAVSFHPAHQGHGDRGQASTDVPAVAIHPRPRRAHEHVADHAVSQRPGAPRSCSSSSG